MVFYGITFFPLTEELQAADLGLLTPFYMENAALEGSVRRSAQLLKLFMERGTYQGYPSNPEKSLFISNTPEQEEEAKK